MDDETWEQVQDIESGRGGIVSSPSWQQNQNQSEGVVIVDAHRKSGGGGGGGGGNQTMRAQYE